MAGKRSGSNLLLPTKWEWRHSMINFELKPTAPFDFELVLGHWLRHPLERVDRVEENSYHRLFVRPSGPVLMTAKSIGTVDAPLISLTLQGENAQQEKEELDWVRETFLWQLNNDADINGFYAHLTKHDPALLKIAKQYPGLRPAQSPFLFETLVFAIVGQQINLNFAYQCKAAIEDAYAQKATINGKEWIAGIQPEDLAGVTIEDLRAMKISNSKGRAITELAESFRQEPLNRQNLAAHSDIEVEAKLVAYRGIGPWTAKYAMMRALARMDALPEGDVALQKAVGRLHGNDAKVSAEEVVKLLEHIRPYRGLATFYLWTSL
jgi:DNA-3-methyladenine glycosylase II